MDERAALLRAICAEPDDDTPRLAFADWLDEHAADGDAGRDDRDRARYIRLSIELDAIEVTDLKCGRSGAALLRPVHGRYEVAAMPRCRCAVCRTVRERDRLAARGIEQWRSAVTGDIVLRMGDAAGPRPRVVTVEFVTARLAEIDRWTWVAAFNRGFAGTLRMSHETFPRYAGELFARGPFTTVELCGLTVMVSSGAGAVTFPEIPAAIRPWLKEHEWPDEGEAEFAVSQACVAFGRAERDKFWAAQAAAA